MWNGRSTTFSTGRAMNYRALMRQKYSHFESFHYLGMRFKDFGCLLGLGGEGPVFVVPGAAEDDAVAARKHVRASAQVTVVNLRLRQQHFQLTAHRNEFLVTKERSCTQSGTVKYD